MVGEYEKTKRGLQKKRIEDLVQVQKDKRARLRDEKRNLTDKLGARAQSIKAELIKIEKTIFDMILIHLFCPLIGVGMEYAFEIELLVEGAKMV